MSFVPEQDVWEEGIYQFEETDVLQGGPNGIDNLPSKQLASRTLYLKNLILAALDNTQPLDDALTSIASLVLVPDRLIYSTGPDTFAMTPISAFIRGLLDDADQGDARTTLGAAGLASPVFTGTPTAPTAAPGTNTTQLATTAFVQAVISAISTAYENVVGNIKMNGVAAIGALNTAARGDHVHPTDTSRAPLASPALTGTPTAPTAATATNTTQIATTAFVQAVVTSLIDASPAALNTLNELAAALGDDPNFATTMTNALAAKASLASPALTGTPTAPTAAAGTNTTQLATTAFVQAVVTTINTALAAKAPLASPALTGTPTAPTAAAGTDTTQLATTAFVQAQLASAFARVASASGYQKISGGLILQWVKAAAVTSQTLSWPIAFPTACLAVSSGIVYATASYVWPVQIQSYSASGVSVYSYNQAGGFIFSIGY